MWTIAVENDTKNNHNGLYRYQLPNGQLLFRKKKGLLQALEMKQVLSLSQLNDLPSGAHVTFSWLQDWLCISQAAPNIVEVVNK